MAVGSLLVSTPTSPGTPEGSPGPAGRLSPGRMRVGILGVGRAGAVLGAALARAGHPVVAVSAVSDASHERAARLLPGARILEDLDVVAEADLVLFGVPEETLAPLLAGLAAAGAFHPGQVLVHVSARQGIGVFEPVAAAHDVLPLALHPALALAGRAEDVERLSGTAFAVTTLKSLRPLGEALVLEMGGEPVWVEEEDRPAYAAALAAVRDGLEGVLGAASRVLADCGFADPGRTLGPLVASTVDGVFRSSVTRDPAGATEPEEHP